MFVDSPSVFGFNGTGELKKRVLHLAGLPHDEPRSYFPKNSLYEESESKPLSNSPFTGLENCNQSTIERNPLLKATSSSMPAHLLSSASSEAFDHTKRTLLFPPSSGKPSKGLLETKKVGFAIDTPSPFKEHSKESES